MKKIIQWPVAIFMFCVFFSAVSSAQQGVTWRGGGGWGSETPYVKMYNPQSVETINGEVISVEQVNLMKGMHYGIHLVVKTETDSLEVHLGPGWYIENQDIKISPKDMVEIKGSRIIYEGKPVLIAAEVRKADEVLSLREENGFPAWSGWRRR